MLTTDQFDRALKHIKYCDEVFDKWGDHEFAYQQVRLLALELIEEHQRKRGENGREDTD
jgi:hypothetical protein